MRTPVERSGEAKESSPGPRPAGVRPYSPAYDGSAFVAVHTPRREDLTAFMVDQLESDQWLTQSVVVGS